MSRRPTSRPPARPESGGQGARSAPRQQLGVIRRANSTFARTIELLHRTDVRRAPHRTPTRPHPCDVQLELNTPHATAKAKPPRQPYHEAKLPYAPRSSKPRAATAVSQATIYQVTSPAVRSGVILRPAIHTARTTRVRHSRQTHARSFPARTTNNELCVYDVKRGPHSGAGCGANSSQNLNKNLVHVE